MKTITYHFDELDDLSLNKENQYIYQYIKDRKLSDIYHDHDFYELVFLLKGTCVHVINEEKHVANPYDFFLIRPGESHVFYGQSNSLELICLSVAAGEFDTLASVYNESSLKALMQYSTPICLRCSQPLEIHYIQQKAVAAYTITDYKMLLFHFLKIFTDHVNSKTNIPEYLQYALLEMRKRENIKLGISAFLNITNYSQTHLSRLMNQYFGVKLHDYVLNLKLEAAYNDLILTTKHLEEISESVGYDSFSHFNKIFKEKYGISPAVLRREHGKPTI